MTLDVRHSAARLHLVQRRERIRFDLAALTHRLEVECRRAGVKLSQVERLARKERS